MPENKKKRTYEEVQAEVNSKLKEKKAYQDRIKTAINHIKDDPEKINKLKKYLEDRTKGSTDINGYCISSACYTLNEAKELLSYVSGTNLQKDIVSGKLPGWKIDYDLNNLEEGDILQQDRINKKGGRGAPFHTMLTENVGKDESGNVTDIKYFGSSGKAESFDSHDIERSTIDKFKKDKNYQIIKKEFVPNSLLRERDMLKPFVQPRVEKYKDYVPNEQIKYLGSNDESEDKKQNREKYINKMMGRKEELMKAYNLSNNEYNDLVKLSAGILDQESEYGTSTRYKLKNIPGVQFAGKLIKGETLKAFDLDEYSVGPGQSKPKYFPSKAGKKFGITPESEEATLITVLDRYSNQVPSNLKGTPAGYLKTANVYKGMSSDTNEYAQSVLDKAASFGFPNYNEGKTSFIDIKNKEREKKQEVMKQSFAPVVNQDNFVNVKKESVVKFKNGGNLNDMPFGMPLKEQNPYLVPEYNQPMVGKTILPDVNRPVLKGTNANEFKSTQGTDQGDVQIPTIVGGQYIGENGAWERYKATKGERFKNMTNPSSYSNFYNQVGNLGLMQSNTKQKFQQGGWLDGLEGDKTEQAPDVTNATEYIKNWYNSPMYGNILRNQIADSGVKNPKRIERVAKRSIKSANKEVNSPFYDITPNIVDNPEYYGRSIDDYKGGRKINLNRNFVENNPKLVNSLFAHELAHDNLITYKDKEYVNKNTPEYNPAIHDEKIYNTLTDPGEVRSQIHSIRQLSGENKIYDPLTQPFKKEYLDKVNESYNQGTKDSENYNQLKRLRKYYSDDQITEMMNTISKSNSNDGKVYARNGGLLNSLSKQRFDMGGTVDDEDSNTPSNATSAMKALMPAIQKSNAQAANTNFNANLNYKTEPTAASTTFVNNNVAKQKAAELAKDIKTYGTPEKAIIAKVAAEAMAEAKKDKNKGTIAKTQSINPNNRWMAGAANYKGDNPEQVVNMHGQTQAIGAMATGAGKIASIPVVSQTLGAGFAAKGVYDIPQTVRTVIDPNVSLHDKAKAVTFNAGDFLGFTEGIKGAKALGKFATEETALKNAYKLNPWAFKPNPEMMYRGIGPRGYKDAIESKVFKSPKKDFETTYWADADNFKRAEHSSWTTNPSESYIAQYPKNKANFETRYAQFGKDQPLFIDFHKVEGSLPIKEGAILKNINGLKV